MLTKQFQKLMDDQDKLDLPFPKIEITRAPDIKLKYNQQVVIQPSKNIFMKPSAKTKSTLDLESVNSNHNHKRMSTTSADQFQFKFQNPYEANNFNASTNFQTTQRSPLRECKTSQMTKRLRYSNSITSNRDYINIFKQNQRK